MEYNQLKLRFNFFKSYFNFGIHLDPLTLNSSKHIFYHFEELIYHFEELMINISLKLMIVSNLKV